MIKQDTKERILNAADVVDVIGGYVDLKRKGKDYTGCCPFHNEKTPSFVVSPVRQIYKCFGCGKGGDAVTFIMEQEGLNFPEALRFLAQKYGIEIEEDPLSSQQLQAQKDQQNHKEAIMIALGFAQKFYAEALTNTPEGKSIGITYFKERGFNLKTVSDFGLGFSTEQKDSLYQAALKAGYTKNALNDANLITLLDGGGVSDRFRGRVMFPITNQQGKTIGFGARALKAAQQPKYLNTSETQVYHKSDVLYGLAQAKASISALNNCYLAEGYTDVISLHQAGVTNVVSSSGTSLTVQQIEKIARFTKNITLLFDGDAAGIKATLRGIDMVLEAGLNVRVVTFPDGNDPDSYLQKVGTDAFKAHLESASINFLSFRLGTYGATLKTDPQLKSNAAKDVVGSICLIPDAITRNIYYREAAQQLGIDEELLVLEGSRLLRDADAQARRRQQREDQRGEQREQRESLKDNLGQQAPQLPNVRPSDTTTDLPSNLPLDIDHFYDDLPPEAYGIDIGTASTLGNNFSLPSVVDTPAPGSDSYSGLLAIASNLSRASTLSEAQLIRLLLLYGEEAKLEYNEMIKAEYILLEIRDHPFVTPVYEKIRTEFITELQAERVPNLGYFINHPDPTVKQAVISLTVDKHVISPFWEKNDIYIPDETEEIFNEELLRLNITFFLYNAARNRSKEILQDLRQSLTIDQEADLIAEIQQVNIFEAECAKKLGIVIGG